MKNQDQEQDKAKNQERRNKKKHKRQFGWGDSLLKGNKGLQR